MGGGGGTVIITSAPGPGLCHSQRFFEIWYGMVWYGMVWYGMVWTWTGDGPGPELDKNSVNIAPLNYFKFAFDFYAKTDQTI